MKVGAIKDFLAELVAHGITHPHVQVRMRVQHIGAMAVEVGRGQLEDGRLRDDLVATTYCVLLKGDSIVV